MTWQTMLFSGQGRIRRRDYWVWSLAAFFVQMVIYFGVALATQTIDNIGDESTPAPLLITQLALMVPSIWIGACLGAKRWHDRNKSGWMYLILLIPLVGPIWTLVECGCLDGTPGPNPYGPSPKGVNNAASVF